MASDRACLPVAWALLLSSCVGSPLHVEEAPVNLPPYIDRDFVSPALDVVRVETAREITLAAEGLFDPNEESALYYVWMGEHSGLLEQAEVGALPGNPRHREVFHVYERVTTRIDPCSERLRDSEDETIWLVVADRRFVRVTGSEVEVAPGGFMVSHSWQLRFRPGLCTEAL